MGANLKRLHSKLLKNRLKIAVAESCTGGLLSSFLTGLPGSSGYFLLGIVTYSNEAKTGILKIPKNTIVKTGAVSRNTALAMAKSVRKLSAADLAIGITGIAGPSGGTKLKPKGTVFIALDSRHKSICRRFLFSGTRSTIRKKACQEAIKMLYRAAC